VLFLSERCLQAIIIDESATEEKAIREFNKWLQQKCSGRYQRNDIVVLWCWFHVLQTWTRCVYAVFSLCVSLLCCVFSFSL
jgi:hypothetical protein